jgi:hypothetical protein
LKISWFFFSAPAGPNCTALNRLNPFEFMVSISRPTWDAIYESVSAAFNLQKSDSSRGM